MVIPACTCDPCELAHELGCAFGRWQREQGPTYYRRVREQLAASRPPADFHGVTHHRYSEEL